MKTIVVFFSLDGNTKLIAQTVAKQLEADTLELKTKKSLPDKGFGKFFWGGKSVMFKETPELIDNPTDLALYDNFVLATPVWAGKYAAPFNTFIKQHPLSGKKLALLVCHGGGGADKCFEAFQKALPGNQFVGQVDFVNPLKIADEAVKKATAWAQGLSF
jgi:flavodoxin